MNVDAQVLRGLTARRRPSDLAAAAGRRAEPDALDFAGGRVLFVASTGGHLTELHRLSTAMGAAADSRWVTFDSEQSRSLLRDSDVSYVPYISPRDLRGTIEAIARLRRIMAETRPVAVVSTGAAVAVSAFVAARLRGIPCHYIESVSRIDGPSLTGRMVAGLRLASLRTQQAAWAGGRWLPYPSVLSEYESVPDRTGAGSGGPLKLFVTLGTIRPYRFDALVDAVLATGLTDARTVWQLGATTRDDLPGRSVTTMSAQEFRACAQEADVVITHAGVGTAIDLLADGVYPLVVPRRRDYDEHVDDHQNQIAALLRDQGLAEVRPVTDVDAASLRRAALMRVRPRGERPAA